MSRSVLITLCTLCAILLVAGVATAILRSGGGGTDVAQNALFTPSKEGIFTDPEGAVFDMTDYKGELAIVTSWASWCPHCKDELVVLDALVGEFPESVALLAINRRESKEVAARYRPNLPELVNTTFVIDTGDAFFNAVEGYAMPETLVFNAQGEKIFHGHGLTDREVLRTVLTEAIQGG